MGRVFSSEAFAARMDRRLKTEPLLDHRGKIIGQILQESPRIRDLERLGYKRRDEVLHLRRLLWGAAYQNPAEQLVIAEWATATWVPGAPLEILERDGAFIITATDQSAEDPT